MSKKIEVLQAVRADIKQNGIIIEQYRDGECYCAVGYVLKALGVTDEELDVLDSTRIECAMSPLYGMVMTNEMSERLSLLAHEAGFSVKELEVLQSVNDKAKTIDAVLAQLDLMEQAVSL